MKKLTKSLYWFAFITFVIFIYCQHGLAADNNLLGIELDFDDIEIDIDMIGVEDVTADAEKKWRLIFSWQNGLDSNALDETVSHRFDSRLDWGQLIWQDYYFKLDGKIILRLPGDDNQANQQKFEFDGRLRELYLQRSLQNWTFTAGFQAIMLGEMDAVLISDLFSPWDYSEFAFTSPEDARLGQLVLNTEWYIEKSRWQFLYSPWPLTNRYPGGDSGGLIKQIFGDQPILIDDNQPELFEQHELLMKWQTNIEGSDFAIIVASLLNNDPSFQISSPQNTVLTQFAVSYSRFHMLVMGANYSAGNFLWKMESAYKQNVQFQTVNNAQGDVWDFAIGADYDANTAWNISIELLNQHLLNSDSQSVQNNTQLVWRWSKNWLNETLSTIIFNSYQFQYGDSVTSISTNYSVDDFWNIALVATVFESNDKSSPAQLTKDWDQLTAKVILSF